MIYVASKTVHAPRWRELRDVHGLPIISTWIDEAGQGESRSLRNLWSRCIAESKACNYLIAYRQPNEILKGAFVEIGAALAVNNRVYLVGFDEQFSFRNHPHVRICATLREAFESSTPGYTSAHWDEVFQSYRRVS